MPYKKVGIYDESDKKDLCILDQPHVSCHLHLFPTYLVAQQSLRLGANELPAQLATETAIKLREGKMLNPRSPLTRLIYQKACLRLSWYLTKTKIFWRLLG
jgi:hypothetical protein